MDVVVIHSFPLGCSLADFQGLIEKLNRRGYGFVKRKFEMGLEKRKKLCYERESL